MWSGSVPSSELFLRIDKKDFKYVQNPCGSCRRGSFSSFFSKGKPCGQLTEEVQPQGGAQFLTDAGCVLQTIGSGTVGGDTCAPAAGRSFMRRSCANSQMTPATAATMDHSAPAPR